MGPASFREIKLATNPRGPLRRLALAALLRLIIGGLGGLLAAMVVRPEPVRARFIPPREPARDFRLRDQDGRSITIAQARGKVIVLTFLYSTAVICARRRPPTSSRRSVSWGLPPPTCWSTA